MNPSQQLLESFVDILIKENGSDLHLSAGRFPVVRASTELITLVNQKKITQEDMKGILTFALGEEKFKKFLIDQEMDFAYNYKDLMRLRGNAAIHQGNFSIAFRLIPKVKTIDELHLPEILKTFATKKQGFFLVVGPVGQGKSTTLSAMIEYINSNRPQHIVTIEDPVEYLYEEKHAMIDQREVGIDTKDFAAALNAIFREDVNVILVGEMRNADTIATAVTAAETGHLVFSTLHTNSAAQTIDRIIDSFPGNQQDQIRSQLANSLLGVFSQRLIPRIAGGLVMAYELLINNAAIANLIREKRTHEIDVVIETGTEQGMVDMNRSLLELVRNGEITMENAYLYSMNPKALERLM